MGRLNYRPALDGLRGLAVLAVLGIHTALPGLPGGARGVDVFFVLSGYLITSILKDQAEAGRIDLIAFWVKRARRLAPALLLMLAVYVTLAPAFLPDHAGGRWVEAAFAALYLTDYSILFTNRMSPIAHTWSLAIEEQFYLIWPLVLVPLVRLKSPAFALLIVWAGLTFLRIGLVAASPDTGGAYYTLHAHSTGLILGAALALGPTLPRVGWIGAGLLVLMLTTPSSLIDDFVWRITLSEVAAAMLIADLVRPGRLTDALSWEPLRKLGLISYGAYLWHLPVVGALWSLPPLPRAALTLAISCVLATISYVTVEHWAKTPKALQPA